MSNLGIIDIGSNTVHLLIINIINKSNHKVVYKSKEHLRLGSELILSKKISSSKIKEIISILKSYLEVCKLFKTSQVIAVATEALRIAENNNHLLYLVKSMLGINIKILSSDEEAYLAYSGVKTIYNLNNGIIIDSGGSSTEFIQVKNNTFIKSSSIHLGAINVTNKIKTNSLGQYINCTYSREYFNNIFSSIHWLKNFNNLTVIGIGGTFKNLRNIYINLNSNINQNISYTEISPFALLLLCNYIKKLSLSERCNLKGLSNKRADIILGGCEIISNLINYLDIKNLIISPEGLRSGIIYNYIEGNYYIKDKTFINKLIVNSN